MNFKKTSLSLISLLAIFLLASFASAAVLTVSSVNYASTASHDSDVTVTFSVAYSGSVNFTTVSFNESYTNIGSWKTLPAATQIANNSLPVSFSAVLNIPRYASGTVNAVLRTKGTITVDTPITITITNAPALSISSVQTLTKTQNATINITNTGNTNLANINMSRTGDLNVSLSSNNFVLTPGSSALVNINLLSNMASLGLGLFTTNIEAKDISTGASGTISYSISNDFCDNGNVNTSKVEIRDIEDVNSDHEWKWKPLDSIEVKAKIRNNVGSDEDFVVELGIYDSIDKKFIDIDDESTLEQDISLDDGDSETVTFTFEAPTELEDSDGRYVVYIKSYVDGEENKYCNSYASKDVPSASSTSSLRIDRDSNDVILQDISVPEIVSAGDTVRISATAHNIGKNDETKVKVAIKNLQLGLDMETLPFSLDVDDSDDASFSFVIPTTAQNGVYTLNLFTMFKYKKSSDTYEKISSDTWTKTIKVVGGTSQNASVSASSGITASLESEAKAGSDMSVTATIKNLGSSTATFIVDVKDYESWATLNSVSSRLFTLSAGESKDVKLSFAVSKNVSGEQTFTIESRAGTNVETKEVAVTIAEGSVLSSLANSLGGKTILWIIGIINVILIVLIIVLAVRIFRR